MRIKSSGLAAHLSQGARPPYAIFDSEPLLLSEGRDAVRKALSCDERAFFLVDAQFDPAAALAECSSGSLFGTTMLLELVCAEPMTATVAGQLTGIAEAASSSGVSVLVASPGIAKWGKWADELEDTFTVVNGVEVGAANMVGWTKQRAARIGLKINDEAVEMLASKNEGNLSMAAQELEKLLITHGGETEVGYEQVREGLTDQTQDSLQSLRESMAGGDVARTVRAVHNLQATKVSEVLVVWALAEEGKALLSLIDNQRPWGLFGKHRSDLGAMSRRTRRKDAATYLAAVSKADLLSKGVGKPTCGVWVLLERIASAFAVLARHNTLDRSLLR